MSYRKIAILCATLLLPAFCRALFADDSVRPSQATLNDSGSALDKFIHDSVLYPASAYTPVQGKDPDGWNFGFEPYLWAMGLDGQVGVKGLPPVNLNASTKKVLQNLDWGVFAKGEVMKGRWGVLADGYFAQLSGGQAPDDRLFSSGSMVVQQAIASLALAYRVIDDRRGFLDLYGGARYNYLGLSASTTVNPSVANDIGFTSTERAAGLISQNVSSAVNSEISTITSQINSGLTQEVQATQQRIASAVATTDPRSIARDILIYSALNNNSRGLSDERAQNIASRFADQYRNYVGTLVRLNMAQSAVQYASTHGGVTPTLINAQTAAQTNATAAKTAFAAAVANGIESEFGNSTSGSQSWVDPIIGLRGQLNITRILFWAIQGDIGGFCAGSQFASNAQSTLGANLSKNVFIEVGYRYMYVDYQNNGFLYKMNSYGLFAGLGFKF